MQAIFKKLTPSIARHIQQQDLVFDATTCFLLLLVSVSAIIGTILYFILPAGRGAGSGPWIAAFILYWATGLSITMGYHRLYSHKAFHAHPWVENILLLLGLMALQNTALKWCSDHRFHHAYTDEDKDPYNSTLGLWWSHILWIFFTPRHYSLGSQDTSVENLRKLFPNAVDLIKNPRVLRQHRWGQQTGIVLTLGFPLVLGIFFQHPFAYFVIAGLLRVFLVHQCTFFINSLAHYWGEKTFNHQLSARDNFFCALISFGEGHHNFHHCFPTDYRNGPRWHQFDPTKWMVYVLAKARLCWGLKRTI